MKGNFDFVEVLASDTVVEPPQMIKVVWNAHDWETGRRQQVLPYLPVTSIVELWKKALNHSEGQFFQGTKMVKLGWKH